MIKESIPVRVLSDEQSGRTDDITDGWLWSNKGHPTTIRVSVVTSNVSYPLDDRGRRHAVADAHDLEAG